MHRALGIIMVGIGVSGIILSLAGLIAGRQLVDSIGAGLETNLTLTLQSLDTVKETLILTKATIGQIDAGLTSVEETADSVSLAIDDTRPLLQQASVVTTEEIPDSIEAVQSAIPALTDAAGTIDDTLRTLDDFRLNRSVLGIPLSFDLGVEYDPEVPIDESVEEIGNSLEGMPQQLRSLRRHLEVTNSNLQTISRNVSDIGTNLGLIKNSVSDLEPLLDDYIALVTDLSDATRQMRFLVSRQLDLVKLVVTVIMLWLALSQVAPIYLGWELLNERREKPIIDRRALPATEEAELS